MLNNIQACQLSWYFWFQQAKMCCIPHRIRLRFQFFPGFRNMWSCVLNVIRFLLHSKPRSQSDFALLCETIWIAKNYFFHVLKQDDVWYVITTHSNYNKNENIRKRVQTTFAFLRQKNLGDHQTIETCHKSFEHLKSEEIFFNVCKLKE